MKKRYRSPRHTAAWQVRAGERASGYSAPAAIPITHCSVVPAAARSSNESEWSVATSRHLDFEAAEGGLAAQHTDHDGSTISSDVAAPVFRQCHAGTFHLPLAGCSAQLFGELNNLGNTRGADGVPLAKQAS
jgi:hypothetical protein